MKPTLKLRIAHALPTRVRLQWAPDVERGALDQLWDQLQCQSWLVHRDRREGSRSLVLDLQPGCPEVRWQLALAALGWQLVDGNPGSARSHRSGHAAVSKGPWLHISRQIGGNLIGAATGQVLLGGAAASVGAALGGAGLAVVLGGTGAVLGAVVGSIVGGAVADGKAESVPSTLGQLTWRRLGTRLGEEAGSSTGMALGSAVAGPLGAVAGLAVGSMVGAQLAADLTAGSQVRQGIGHRRWLVGMVRDTTSETLTEGLAARLGASLTGGSETGRQLGASLGLKFARRIDWNATLQHHQLMPLQPKNSAQGRRHQVSG